MAKAMAANGAEVFLTGRRLASVELTARAIREAGGVAHAAQLDASETVPVEQHLENLVQRTGGLDISFNAIGIPQQGIQGVPLVNMEAKNFMLPIQSYMTSHFVTSTAAARRMKEKGKGVILMHTPEPARLGAAHVGGMGPAWAAMEGLNRSLSAELGPFGIRSVVLRTTGIPETETIDLVFDLHAKAIGMTRPQFQVLLESMTHRRKSTTLAELASVAVFMASDEAKAMTGTVANLTGGIIVD
jgi:NAD(P)-dependent dehydrogenase (short-subunit alcohol dehydrogenase family)